MVTLRDGKQATTSNAQVGKRRAPKRTSKRAAAESQEAQKENKRPKVEVTEGQAQDQKHDSGSFGKSTDTAETQTNDQTKDTPVESENKAVRETRELDDEAPAQKNAANSAELKQEDEKRPARSRDRLPTPGRNHAAVTDLAARDNLTDPCLPPREADRLQQEIDNFPRKKGPKSNALKNLEFVRDSFLNPDEAFHDLHICYAEGPHGSATYDRQGFQLDYDKVSNWMKPISVSSLKCTRKKREKWEKMLAKEAEDEKRMTEIFYEEGAAPTKEETWNGVIDFWKLAVSKDLGVPWHHIDLKHWILVGRKATKSGTCQKGRISGSDGSRI
ncbi:hypothetical protein BDV97DRAFT_364102 [Delphinella strobiligena]|nr:hypothetical protein BDV97DRAFT_364102 [Delphinella strobiligena]